MRALEECTDIVFDEQSHSYHHRYSGMRFIGWSSLKDKFTVPFDADGSTAARCAKKEGITTRAMQARWKNKSDTAIEYGKRIHLGLESIYKNRAQALDGEQQYWVDQVSGSPQLCAAFPPGECISEQVLYCTKSYVAGTTDLLRMQGRYIHLGDFKTNEKIKTYNVYDAYLTDPFSAIGDYSMMMYTLQLSVYMVLACRMTGLLPGTITLIHLNKVNKKLYLYTPELMLDTAEKMIGLAYKFVL